MSAGFLLLRADWRTRWRSLAALAVLIGLGAGIPVAAAAAQRRTSSSLERLAETTRAADALVEIGTFDEDLVASVASLPSVRSAAAVTVVFAAIDGVEVDVGLLLPRSEGVGVDVEEEVILRGRTSDPARADEVTMNETTARLTGVRAGGTVLVHTLSPEQYEAERYFPSEGPDLELQVVGITRGIDDATSRQAGKIVATPALHESIRGEVHEFSSVVAVRLLDGVEVATFREELSASVPSDRSVDVVSQDVRSKAAGSTVSTLAAGLGLFAAGSALVTLVVVGQLVGRHVAEARVDDPLLRGLGMTSGARRGTMASTVAPAVAAGAVLAVASAAATSLITPIGLAREIEPTPGLRLDWPVLLAGALGTAVAMALVAGGTAWWSTRPPVSGPLRRPAAAAGIAARAGAGPSVVNGVNLALDRRGAQRPVRAGISFVVLGVVLAVALLTFSSSLDRLVASPDRWGYGWDLTFELTSDTVGAATEELSRNDELSAVGRLDAGTTVVGGRSVRAFGLEPVRGLVGYSLRQGRQPAGAVEVVVGPVTAAREDLAVGDELVVSHPEGGEVARVEVVGIGLFPEIDEGDFTDAVGFAGPGFLAHASVPAAFEASQVVARIADGRDVADVVADLRDPLAAPGLAPTRPGDIATLSSVRSIPRWLLVFVGLLGVVSFLHILRTTAIRQRLELAVLCVLGMTKRQLRACTVVQALTVAVVAVAVGVPLGVAAGRLAWRAVAGSIEVGTDPDVPVAALGAVTVTTILVAVAAAALISTATAPGTGSALRGASPEDRRGGRSVAAGRVDR